MAKGFMYLTAVIDVYSRCILAWNLTNTMDAEICKEVIEFAIEIHGAPEIINTDQGSQYSSHIFTGDVSKLYSTKLSMDGKGRDTDKRLHITILAPYKI
jgi:putative transposase